MLNSGKKNSRLARQKKKILSLVLSEKKILNETKNHNPPPLQVKWSVPKDGQTNNIRIIRIRYPCPVRNVASCTNENMEHICSAKIPVWP